LSADVLGSVSLSIFQTVKPNEAHSGEDRLAADLEDKPKFKNASLAGILTR